MGIQLVITCGYAAKLLEAVEEPLDGLALGVADRVVGPRQATLAAGWDDGLRAADGQGRLERVGIVAAVGNQVGWDQPVKQRQGLRGVGALARRPADAHQAPAGVGYDM